MSQSFKIMPGGAQRESGSFIDGNKFMQMYLDEYKNIVSSSKLVSWNFFYFLKLTFIYFNFNYYKLYKFINWANYN